MMLYEFGHEWVWVCCVVTGVGRNEVEFVGRVGRKRKSSSLMSFLFYNVGNVINMTNWISGKHFRNIYQIRL